MKNNDDSIKQENRKALPKFIFMGVGGMILGAIIGVILVWLDFENFAGVLTAAGLFFTVKVSPWLLFALPVVELAACLPIYFGAKRRLADWDGENEEAGGIIEAKLSVCMWAASIATILDFFLLATLLSGFLENAKAIGQVKFFGCLAVFLVTLYLNAVFQQKLVDTTKRMNPEKQGSVYDTKFQKKWFESCDEAERAIIGQCAFKAYQAMARTCLILWAVFALGGMFFSWGMAPAMAVCMIWGVGQSVYSYWCLKLGKPGGTGSPM